MMNSSVPVNILKYTTMFDLAHLMPIGLKVNAVITPRAVPFRCRFNLRKANWTKFRPSLTGAGCEGFLRAEGEFINVEWSEGG